MACLTSCLGSLFQSANVLIINGEKYTMKSQLGEGGFATVWLAEDEGESQFAVKRIECYDPNQKKLANIEMQTFQKFSDHPHILKMHDWMVRPSSKHAGGEEMILVLDFYPRGSLHDLIEKLKAERRQMSETGLLRIFLGVCEAVQLFHNSSPPLVHRDLKPHNILLGRDNSPVLMDFGSVTTAKKTIVTHQDELDLLDEAEKLTTPQYRAPELFDRGAVDPVPVDEKIDIWALGCLLYTMAFLENNFDKAVEKGGNLKLAVMAGKVAFPAHHQFSKGLCDLILDMHSVDPTKRPNIAQVIATVKDLLEEA